MAHQEAEEGSFVAGEFPALLRGLGAGGADGRLDVDTGRGSCALFFRQGRIVAVAADEEQYKLGGWLSARGIVEPQRVALALLKQPDGVSLGRYLVAEGWLEEEQLREELQLRSAAIIGLLLFAAGRYSFVAGAELTGEAVELSSSTTSLLLAAARGSDAEHLRSVVAESGEPAGVDRTTVEAVGDLALTPSEAFLLSRLEDETRPERLARLVPMPKEDMERALGVLVIAGLAELRGGEEVAATAEVTAEVLEEEAVRRSPFSEAEAAERRAIVRLAASIAHRDHYRRLGLSRGATQVQIHDRFKELSTLYGEERVAERHLASLAEPLEAIRGAITEAYRVLTDPKQRETYDARLRDGSAGQSRGEGGSVSVDQDARREVVEANLKRANDLVQMGEVGEAVQLLDQASRLDPRPGTLLTLARLELQNPMWSQRALDRLKRAIDIDPHYTDAWLELAAFWERRKKYGRQRECLRKILEYDPDNRDVQRALIEIGVV